MENIIVFCGQCRFYEPINDGTGHCHRNPPDNGYTRVIVTWWCSKGESTYKPRITKSKKGKKDNDEK